MKLIICRHGETAENKNRIVQGQLPGQLTVKGIEQAKELAKKLKDEHFDYIYSSDLARAADTANEIKQFHPDTPCEFTARAREFNFGDFQGLKAADVDWDGLGGTFWDKQIPGGETNRIMSQRIIDFVNDLLKKHEGKSVLVVAHGGVMRHFKAAFEKISLEQLFKEYVENGERWEFQISEPVKLYTPNEQ